MKDKLSKTPFIFAGVLFAIALALVSVTGYCDWFSPIAGMFGLKGKGMNANNTTGEANHIKVVREVALEIGRAPTPYALAQTKDGGYVIAGSVWVPWATRVDANGTVVWRYELSAYNPSAPKEGEGQYNGVAVLPDDSAILCGEMALPLPPGKPGGGVVGMLTHLDKAGQTLSHQLLYPNGDKSYSLSYLNKCIPWGDGVVVVGNTYRQHEYSTWLIALDAKGEIRWEKLISMTTDGDIEVIPNQDLLLLVDFQGEKINWMNGSIPTESTEWSNGSICLDPTGEIKWQRAGKSQLKVDHQKLVTPLVAESQVRLFISNSQSQSASLRILNEHGEEMKSAAFQIRPLSPKHMYLMPNHDLVFFGTEYGQEGNDHPSAGITWLSADLKSNETFTFRNKSYSAGIDDALPTGKHGEFVTLRRAFEISNQDKRQGIVLTFVQVQ